MTWCSAHGLEALESEPSRAAFFSRALAYLMASASLVDVSSEHSRSLSDQPFIDRCRIDSSGFSLRCHVRTVREVLAPAIARCCTRRGFRVAGRSRVVWKRDCRVHPKP